MPSEYFLEDSSVRSHLSDVKCTGTEERLSYCGTGRDDENGSGNNEDNNNDCDTVFIRCDGKHLTKL